MKYLLSVLLLCSVLIAVDDKILIQENGTFVIVDRSLSAPVTTQKVDITGYTNISTLGISGNGTNEYAALNAAISGGGKFYIDGLDIRIDSMITATKALYLVGLNGASIYSGNTSSTFPHALIYAKKYLYSEGIEYNGNDVCEKAIYAHNSVDIINNHMHHFVTNKNSELNGALASADGFSFFPTPPAAYELNIIGNNIHDINGYNDGKFVASEDRGSTRGVMIRTYSSQVKLDVKINNNTFDSIIGEQGDTIYIYDITNGTDTSHYEISYNKFKNVHRRAIKERAYNVHIHHNDIESLPYPHKSIWLANPATDSWNVTAPISHTAAGYTGLSIHDNTIRYYSKGNGIISIVDAKGADIRNNNVYIRVPNDSTYESSFLMLQGTASRDVTVENNTIDTDAYSLFRSYKSAGGTNIKIDNNHFILHNGNKKVIMTGGTWSGVTFSNNTLDKNDITDLTPFNDFIAVQPGSFK